MYVVHFGWFFLFFFFFLCVRCACVSAFRSRLTAIRDNRLIYIYIYSSSVLDITFIYYYSSIYICIHRYVYSLLLLLSSLALYIVHIRHCIDIEKINSKHVLVLRRYCVPAVHTINGNQICICSLVNNSNSDSRNRIQSRCSPSRKIFVSPSKRLVYYCYSF